MLGVWIEPVTAQVMMTLPCAALMGRFSYEVSNASANGNGLPGDVPSSGRGEKERRVGDVLRRHRGLQADSLDHFFEYFLRRGTKGLRLRRNDPVHPLAFDDAGLDAV